MKLRSLIDTRSIGAWMLVLLAGFAVALWLSPVYGLVLIALLYIAGFGYKVYETKSEQKLRRKVPPQEPLPDLQPFVYRGAPHPLQMDPPPIVTVRQDPVSATPISVAPDERLAQIQRLRLAIYELVVVNRHSPVVEVIGDDILKESQDLLQEAIAIGRAKQRLDGDLAICKNPADEISRLEELAQKEMDFRLQRTLRETLASKKAEADAIEQLERDRAYHGALLEQAEASLSEMRSRLALTISKAHEYANPEEKQRLVEASGDLRSISEAMRKTLAEIGEVS